MGTFLLEVSGTSIGASFFEMELKPTGKDSADPTQHEFQHHRVHNIGQEEPISKHRSRVER